VAAAPAAPAPRAAAPAAPAPAPAPQVASAAPAAPAAPAAAAASGESRAAVEAAVHHWAKSWASKDIGAYLASYGREFDPPGRMNRTQWEQERRARILGKSKISVEINDLSVSVNGNRAVAHFRQNYSADRLHVTSRKTLELQRSGEHWAIVRESSGG
jgi:ketosteroid isomerase-like protein